jgi:hypothetical protein
MATNATTWFYAEPETNRPYLITERVTHTFWANRLSGVYLNCVKADKPYRVEGIWEGMHIAMEWDVRNYFTLIADKENKALITVCSEVLGFRPTVSYTDSDNLHYTEWHLSGGTDRLRSVQGNPVYRNIKKYR